MITNVSVQTKLFEIGINIMLLANVVKLFSKNIYFANKLFGKLECIYNIIVSFNSYNDGILYLKHTLNLNSCNIVKWESWTVTLAVE